MEQKLEMRTLKGQDTFTILRLLSKLGIKDIITEIFTKEKDDEDAQARGAKIIATLTDALTEKLPLVQDDLNAFLADLTNTEVAVIMDLDFEPYMDLIMDFVQKEELKSFLTRALSFSNMAK